MTEKPCLILLGVGFDELRVELRVELWVELWVAGNRVNAREGIHRRVIRFQSSPRYNNSRR